MRGVVAVILFVVSGAFIVAGSGIVFVSVVAMGPLDIKAYAFTCGAAVLALGAAAVAVGVRQLRRRRA